MQIGPGDHGSQFCTILAYIFFKFTSCVFSFPEWLRSPFEALSFSLLQFLFSHSFQVFKMFYNSCLLMSEKKKERKFDCLFFIMWPSFRCSTISVWIYSYFFFCPSGRQEWMKWKLECVNKMSDKTDRNTLVFPPVATTINCASKQIASPSLGNKPRIASVKMATTFQDFLLSRFFLPKVWTVRHTHWKICCVRSACARLVSGTGSRRLRRV